MPEQKNIHFNGLNGIRAICALAVVVSHVGLGLSNIGIETGYSFGLATYGVTAFFALSGFLITYLLTQEKIMHGTIAVKKFYLRRILRIWPLYFGYLLVVLLVDRFVFHVTDFSSLGFYVFFFPNVPFACANAGTETFTQLLFLGHFWSLGVEEQFYAFYPWLIKSFKKIVVVLVSMLCIMLLLKVVAKYWLFKTGNSFWYAWVAATPFEAMAIGGLGAWLYKEKPQLVLALVKNRLLQIVVTIIILLVIVDKLKIINPFSHTLTAVVTVMVIYYAHLLEKPVFNLRNKYLDQLGKMSYGIYVYHPLVMGIMGLFIRGTVLSPVFKIVLLFIATLSVTILLAYLSYHYFEKYFLDLKSRYAIVKSKD
jgi:peptidoglycan/LPS O-acetylase OafA/YrhL